MDDTQGTTTGDPSFEETPGSSPSGDGTGKPGVDVQGMLGQLQAMITKVAHASEPTLREVAAKAAELAAVAGERAGPLAHTIADRTEDLGHTMAGRATGFASSIRSAAGRGEADEASVPADALNVTDPAEDSQRDGA